VRDRSVGLAAQYVDLAVVRIMRRFTGLKWFLIALPKELGFAEVLPG
jgi:hypothetical protein